MVQLMCSLCGTHSEKNLRMLLKHIRLIHADDPHFSIECTLQGCQRKFRNFHTYRNHVYFSHKNYNGEPSKDSGGQQNPPSDSDSDKNETSDEDSDDQDIDDSNNNADEDADDPNPPNLSRAAAIWILKVREKYLLPQSTIEAVIQDIDTLYEVALDNVHIGVKRKLAEAGINSDEIDGLNEMFNPYGPHGCLFKDLDTHYKHVKYCKTHLKYVEPKSIVLGTRRISMGTGRKRRLVMKEDTMMYVPLLETLRVMLENEAVMTEIQNCHFCDNGLMMDYCDGDEFKRHPLFSSQPHAIQIIMYYDDVEICNPLGSRRTKHKLGIFYYMIGNISPKYRSRVNSIQLLAIVKTKNIKKYSMNTILSPIIKDVAELEKGYSFIINGAPQIHHGTLATISADNLAQCSIGGFKEGSTAHRGCRQCMAKRNHFQTVFVENTVAPLRTLHKHKKQCKKLCTLKTTDSKLYKKMSKKYGINEQSILLTLSILTYAVVH